MPFARISAAFSMKPDRWLSEQVGVNAASYPRRGPWSRRSLWLPATGGRAVCLRPESPSRSSLQQVSNRDPTSSHPGVTTPGARESGSADRGFESSRPTTYSLNSKASGTRTAAQKPARLAYPYACPACLRGPGRGPGRGCLSYNSEPRHRRSLVHRPAAVASAFAGTGMPG